MIMKSNCHSHLVKLNHLVRHGTSKTSENFLIMWILTNQIMSKTWFTAIIIHCLDEFMHMHVQYLYPWISMFTNVLYIKQLNNDSRKIYEMIFFREIATLG